MPDRSTTTDLKRRLISTSFSKGNLASGIFSEFMRVDIKTS